MLKFEENTVCSQTPDLVICGAMSSRWSWVGLGLGQVNTRKGIILWGEGLLDLVGNLLTWLASDVLITNIIVTGLPSSQHILTL